MILFEKKNKHGNFDDLMGVSIETTDKWLDKKLNANICYGKGGGGTQQQDVPATLRPYVKQVLEERKVFTAATLHFKDTKAKEL